MFTFFMILPGLWPSHCTLRPTPGVRFSRLDWLRVAKANWFGATELTIQLISVYLIQFCKLNYELIMFDILILLYFLAVIEAIRRIVLERKKKRKAKMKLDQFLEEHPKKVQNQHQGIGKETK